MLHACLRRQAAGQEHGGGDGAPGGGAEAGRLGATVPPGGDHGERRGSPFGRCRCSPLPVLVLAASKLVAMAGAGSVFFESSKRFLPSVE